MLRLKGITKNYVTASETVAALKGIDLSFRKQEFVSILGASGCGKTTLLNIIGGLDSYTSGDLIIAGKSTRSFHDRDWDVYRNHRVGFIFQSYNLIPHQTVLGNVELALTIAGISRKERTRRAKAVLDRVGLSGKYYQKPNQLSGGQCQRVAIARALVNDPEILLADEPTGALDTVTSKQIMDLIREISGERLVIMVTHNPELAEEYSTRIIQLSDGRVMSDTRPFSEKDEKRECAFLAEQAKEERLERKKLPRRERRKRGGKEKAKMSLRTAFMLSAKNLFSKKGRTAMVGIAGSIGIIGIACVLSFSAGIKGYVASMQDDMLSGNPITITETAYDLNALTGMMDSIDKETPEVLEGNVYVQSLIRYIYDTYEQMNSMMIKNDLTEDYINYVKNMPKEYYAAMLLDYGLDLSHNIYTDFKTSADAEATNHSVGVLLSIYTSILKETEFAQYAGYVTSLVSGFQQMPNSPDYILSQYDCLSGKLATEKDEIMLVVNSDTRLTDVLLATLGYYTQDEFLNMIYKTADPENYNSALERESFTYEELLGKEFIYYPNDTVYTATGMPFSPFSYQANGDALDGEGAVKLKIAGILRPKENVSFGSLSSGIYYTEALTEHVLESGRDSEIVSYLKSIGSEAFYSMSTPITYTYTYEYGGVQKTATGFVGKDMSMALGLGSLMGGGASGGMGGTSGGAGGATGGGSTGGSSLPGGVPGGSGGASGGMGGMMGSMNALYVLSLRNLGGIDLANAVSIYPNDFDSKDLATGYLDAWNGDNEVTVGDKVIAAEDRADVTYTDTLSLVINLINNMIDIVSYALIAFTSISLVVSTVMIGIITYVSVVERIKEIGVIRSLGGRKKDVSHLFNAETFIIGLFSGLFGVAITYIVSAIASAIVYSLSGIPNIAFLPLGNAVTLVALSVLLTLISGLIPARSAANKDPVVALRTE